MEIQNCDNLSLILQLPKNNNIIIGKLKFNSRRINFNERISQLYMNSIGFTPHMNGKDYVIYEANCYANGNVDIYKKYKQGNCSSCDRGLDITNSEFLTMDNLLNGFTFVLSTYNGDVVDINKYMITKMGQENFSINYIDNLHLSFKDKNLLINRNNEDVILEDTKTFFEDVHYWEDYLFNDMKSLIFNSFVDEKGFLDIHEKYREFICVEPSINSYYKLFGYYYYVGQLDFYLLAEYYIKNDLKELKKHNPIFTGKSIEKISDIPKLSKLGMEIFKKYRFSEDDDILFKMEADPKIGVSGLKIIYECIDSINKIKASSSTIFWISNECYLFEKIYFILNKFDITPKNLMDRLIRSMFNENLSIYKYTNIIIDYYKMAKTLNVEIDKKIPTDVIRLHDLFSDQIEFIKDAEIETMFAETIIQNNKLLSNLPNSNDFTIISPKDPSDLIYEGLVLNHCVGSYINRYATGYSKIFFIRRKSLIDQPFVTIELDRNNKLTQISARSNQTPNQAIIDFVNNWINNLNNRGII